MKRKIIFLILLFIPFFVFALSNDYKDNVADIVGVEKEEKVKLYLFHSADCSHCAAEMKWLKDIEDS